MKIECKLKREGGSVIELGGVEYHFKPQADGAHVDDVAYEEHIERFLSIPEAYCIYKPGTAVKEAPAAAPVAKETSEPQPQETTEAPEAAEAGDDLDALKEAFKAKFGHAPHYKWTIQTIKTKLAE